MIDFDINEIKRLAKKELEEELFRKEVDKYKEKLRNKRTIWDKLFPYKLIIIRKDKQNV